MKGKILFYKNVRKTVFIEIGFLEVILWELFHNTLSFIISQVIAFLLLFTIF